MATLSEITEGHSKRISKITKIREDRLREARDARDRDLRALPEAAPFFAAFDEQIAEAHDRRLATDGRAGTGRANALTEVGDTMSDALAEAHRVRREADLAAIEKRSKAEADAEREFLLAIGAGASQPTSTQAQRIRAQKLENAKKEFEAAMAASQEQFRKAVAAALVAESRGSRDAARSFDAAARANEASVKAAHAAAEQTLNKALAALPEAAAEFAEFRAATTAILEEFKRAENEEFARFHEEMQALRG